MSPACSECGTIMSPVHEEAGEVASFGCKHCGNVFFPDAPTETESGEPTDNETTGPTSEDGVVALGETIGSCCPVCDEQPLAKGHIEKRPALFCEKCLGVLISNANFTEVLGKRRSGRMRSDADVDPEPINQDEYNRRIQCPNCSCRMDVHPYYGPGNVVIDSCCRCFLIWFDHGEISKIERA